MLRRYTSARICRMYKFTLLLTAFVASVILCLPISAETHWLTANQFAEKISETRKPQIIDLRTSDESGGKMLKTAHLKPFVRGDFLSDRTVSPVMLKPDAPLFVYCQDGQRSKQAEPILQSQGFDEIWVLEGGMNAWRQAGLPIIDHMADFWNKAFSGKKYFIGTEPDEFFAEEIAKLRPGKLLLPGEGEGRNAVYAATNGWDVYAFDISTKGREKAHRLADAHGVTLKYKIADFEAPQLLPNKYDVVAIIDLPILPTARKKGFAAIRQCLKPGGMIIYEGFAPRPEDHVWASTSDLKTAFAGFKFKMLESHNAIRNREGKGHIDLVVRMVAVK